MIIISYMIQLLSDRNGFFASDNTVTHLKSKQIGEFRYTGVIIALCQHTDRLQRIINKMGIDLILKCPHISLLLTLLGEGYFLQQILDPYDHSIKMTAKHSNLIIIFGVLPDI
ncbi:hypothetical protein D3C71_1482600 [compost metagenome]